MIKFLVDSIYVRFDGQLFRQIVGISMGTNCAPLLADLFLYSCENEFLIHHIITMMTLSLSIIKDLRSLFLIFTPENSQCLKPRNLPQLLHLTSTLRTFPLCQAIFHQHQPMVSMDLSSFAMPVVTQIIVTFHHATEP